MTSHIAQTVQLFHEAGILARTIRSGTLFLGSGDQSVAEHSFGVLTIAFALVRLVDQPIDELRLLQLCLFHDLPEARSGDLNAVQKEYVAVNQAKLLDDFENLSPLHKEITVLIREFEGQATLEARLAKDADLLELLTYLKFQEERGNSQATEWITNVTEKLQFEVSKELAQQIISHPSDEWWKMLRS